MHKKTTEQKNTAVATNTSVGTNAAIASSQSLQTDTSIQYEASADLQNLDATQSFYKDILEEMDFLSHKEKKSDQPVSQGQKLLEKISSSELAQVQTTNRLLGILGPCALKGHIVHFFNIHFKIEKHIKTLSELGDPRFVEAYHYLKAHPAVEAVFVYEKSIVATYRNGGQLIYKQV